jgi:hypothetical protein
VVIDPGSSYAVKTYFFALTVGAGAFQHGKFAGVSAAASAIIGPSAGQKAVPAILAQAVVSFTSAFATIYADCRPEELVEALQNKGAGLLCKQKSSFWSCRIHTGNYIEKNSDKLHRNSENQFSHRSVLADDSPL